MATSSYMSGRKKYGRPQGLLFSENPGELVNGLYVPQGYEVGADNTLAEADEIDQFIILSDHNRSSIDFSAVRIEDRKRMINGRMRSYHVADKKTISCSWDLLPSRSTRYYQDFDSNGIANYNGASSRNADGTSYNSNTLYTADGGAGGVELLDWYENHPGSFWVFLAYDKFTNFPEVDEEEVGRYDHLGQYSEIIEVYFSDFSYTVVNRGGIHDFWNISLTLEEV